MAFLQKALVECVPAAVSNDPTGICATLTAALGTHNPVNSGFYSFVLDNGEHAALLQQFIDCGGVTGCASSAPAAPIDYASLGAIWTFGFVSVLILWLVAKNAGIIVDAVRRF